jgi:uncharacterized membrane protein YoaK (UPF0700 family)
MKKNDERRPPWEKVVWIVVNTIFAVGVLVYVAFYAQSFDDFQKIVVLLVAVIIYAAARALLRIAFRTRRTLRSSSLPDL